MSGRKRVCRIVLGTAVGLCVWAALVFSAAGIRMLIENTKYHSYAHCNGWEDMYYNDFGHTKPKSDKIALTGTHRYENGLVFENQSQNKQVLVVLGDLTVNKEFRLVNICLIVEGSLTADKMVFSDNTNFYEPYIKNNGVFRANVLDAGACTFYNAGNAVINESYAEVYQGKAGLLEIGEQKVPCSVTVDTWAETFSGNRRFVEIHSFERANVTVIDNGLKTDAGFYFSPQRAERNALVYIIIPTIVLGTMCVSGLICLCVVQFQKRKPPGGTYFSGGIFKYWGYSLLFGFIHLLTLCMIKPYLDEIYYKWACKNITLNGKPLVFTGRADSIFYRNMAWALLTIVTLGVYAFWAVPKYWRWIAAGTHGLGETEDSDYTGTTKQLFRTILRNFLRAAGLIVGTFLWILLVAFTAIKGPAWLIVSFALLALLFVLFFFAAAWLYCRMVNDFVALTWNRTRIDGTELYGKQIGLKRFYVLGLLTLLTLGGYAFVTAYRLNCMVVENTIPLTRGGAVGRHAGNCGSL